MSVPCLVSEFLATKQNDGSQNRQGKGDDRKNTDKLTDIQDKVDKIIEITSHLKWLGRDTTTTDNEDEEEEEDDEEKDDCTGKEDCDCQECREYNFTDLEVERLKNEVERLKKTSTSVKSIKTKDYTDDDDNTEDDTDSNLNNSDLAGEGFTTDDD